MSKCLLVICCLCFWAGCKKELNYSYAFYLDGTDYHGNSYSAVYQYDSVAMLKEFAADFFIGNVSDTNYVQVSFSGNNYITPGTYYTNAGNPGFIVCSFAYVKNHIYYANATGNVQILQIDTVSHSITGNFDFKAVNTASPTDTITVSSGAFSSINYTVK